MHRTESTVPSVLAQHEKSSLDSFQQGVSVGNLEALEEHASHIGIRLEYLNTYCHARSGETFEQQTPAQRPEHCAYDPLSVQNKRFPSLQPKLKSKDKKNLELRKKTMDEYIRRKALEICILIEHVIDLIPSYLTSPDWNEFKKKSWLSPVESKSNTFSELFGWVLFRIEKKVFYVNCNRKNN